MYQKVSLCGFKGLVKREEAMYNKTLYTTDPVDLKEGDQTNRRKRGSFF